MISTALCAMGMGLCIGYNEEGEGVADVTFIERFSGCLNGSNASASEDSGPIISLEHSVTDKEVIEEAQMAPPRRRGKRVALIGSSGGGAATLTSGESIIESIRVHLRLIKGPFDQCELSSTDGSAQHEVDLSFATLIVCSTGLDFASSSSDVALWKISEGGELSKAANGSLSAVNDIASLEDSALARLIDSNEIDALVAISSDPNSVNAKAIDAAVRRGIPIVGTGGQSISHIATSGGNVIGCSGGSVATTATSRGICFAASLSAQWKLSYKPPARRLSDLFFKTQAVIGASLPIILTVAVLNRLIVMLEPMLLWESDSPYGSSYVKQFKVNLLRLLPSVIASIACTEYSGLSELSMISGAAAGCLGQGGVFVSVINGVLCGELLLRSLVMCARRSYLPTATTILSIGTSSAISGLFAILIQSLYRKMTAAVSVQFTSLVAPFTNDMTTLIAGAVLGLLTSWGSENGYYHAVILPLIAIQMEDGELGWMGSYDAVCLCLPCAGVCAAVWLLNSFSLSSSFALLAIDDDTSGSHQQFVEGEGSATSTTTTMRAKIQRHVTLGRKGFVSNFFMGDFVEACYPYTLGHGRQSLNLLVWIRIACALSGALILLADLRSSAYLPMPIAWFFSTIHAASKTHMQDQSTAIAVVVADRSNSFTDGFLSMVVWLKGSPMFASSVAFAMAFVIPFMATILSYL